MSASSPLLAALGQRLEALERQHLIRQRRIVAGPHAPAMTVDGKPMLAFCSNDYLGLAADTRVVAALREGASLYGAGSGASHLISGHSAAHAALEMYAEAFDSVGKLAQLEAFASFNGADFYGLPRNTGTITLKRESWTPPESFQFGEADLKPLRSGESLPWRVA